MMEILIRYTALVVGLMEIEK
jgi:hypothetical protein